MPTWDSAVINAAEPRPREAVFDLTQLLSQEELESAVEEATRLRDEANAKQAAEAEKANQYPAETYCESDEEKHLRLAREELETFLQGETQ